MCRRIASLVLVISGKVAPSSLHRHHYSSLSWGGWIMPCVSAMSRGLVLHSTLDMLADVNNLAASLLYTSLNLTAASSSPVLLGNFNLYPSPEATPRFCPEVCVLHLVYSRTRFLTVMSGLRTYAQLLHPRIDGSFPEQSLCPHTFL